jgi:hypothetical protein
MLGVDLIKESYPRAFIAVLPASQRVDGRAYLGLACRAVAGGSRVLWLCGCLYRDTGEEAVFEG